MFESIATLFFSTALLLGSPGPAPISLAVVSSSFGLRAGINYLTGVLSGLFIVTVLTGFGLYEVLSAYPEVSFALSVLAFLYMLYIIYKIAFANSLTNDNLTSAPRFKDGLILNITNPKAYAAFFAIYSSFLLPLENQFLATSLTGLVGFSAGMIVDFCWVIFGVTLSRFLVDQKNQKNFRILCAAVLLVVVLYSFFKVMRQV